MKRLFTLWLLALSLHGFDLDPAQTLRLAEKIWHNEGGKDPSRLTHWNQNETFASMGMGHFIWYPETTTHRPYRESFPKLLAFFEKNGIRLPDGITPASPCPWPDREAFYREYDSPRMQALRSLLKSTFSEQARFMLLRLQNALETLLTHLPQSRRPLIRKRYEALASTPEGLYALMDYINFKGEGTAPGERYQGQGWGLLQVLQSMPENSLQSFVKAADFVLTRRVLLAPKEESQWLPGWRNRLKRYLSP